MVMVATTDQKARLLDLTTGVLELVRDGKRDPEEVCDVLQVIKGERNFAFILGCKQQILISRFKIRKTIKLGLHKSPKEYRKTFAGKCEIGIYAGQILDETPVSQDEVAIGLVFVMGRQLGFKRSACRDAIYAHALELGLEKCPAEVGPALREQYPDQPMGEGVVIGMDPIADSGGDLRVFGVEHYDGGLWLYGGRGNPDRVWNPDDLWVFALSRK